MKAIVILVTLTACAGGSDARVELCNGLDDDLNGVVDDNAADAVQVWVDGDGDGYGRGEALWVCDPAGRATKGGDCDDTHPNVWPGRPELCNGLDDDCDGVVGIEELDEDEDGWRACWDCNDRDGLMYPGADETCNRRDDDCDGEVDEDPVDGVEHFADEDGDGFGGVESRLVTCRLPQGRVTQGGDCDDGAADVRPGVREHCDDVDHDCNGVRWPRLTVPVDVPRLDDAVARTRRGGTVCVEPGEHRFSSLQLNDVWVEGTADGVVLKGPVVLVSGAGLKGLSAHGALQLMHAGATLQDVTVRAVTVLSGNDPLSTSLINLRVTDTCVGLELGGLAVEGLRLDQLSTTCSVSVGDVTDLQIDQVTYDSYPRKALLSAGRVTGFDISDVEVRVGVLVDAGSMTDGRVSDADVYGGTLLRVGALSDVVVERVSGGPAAYSQARLIDARYGEVRRVSVRDARWSGGPLYGPLIKSNKVTDIEVYNAFIDSGSVIGAIVEANDLKRVDVRQVKVRGTLWGLVSGRGAVSVKGLIVAGVDVEDAPGGIVLAGSTSLSQATLTGISGDGPLLGVGVTGAENIDVSWCDVEALSVDGTVNYSNVWESGGAEWSSSVSPMAVVPRYRSRGGSDATLWDLHLKSTSALIDAGSPSAQRDDDGTIADVGAFGGPRGSSW